ncbi:type VII secretion protein EccE [Mycobacterium sp. E2327]|uniref:type VII secretion protein EccE n=1 Tax=Mycobacterium sp. E2327 TaxID=1834132 RepID=UPI0007FCEC98|nr:type VII secretion protein EccE [Mycobacterium sp. E2327]OBI13622.1 type VII secretion protein EccE [Mycobacterium sp. E2327]
MKAQPRLGLALSWPKTTSAFLIDVAVLVVVRKLAGGPQTAMWWGGVAVAVIATAALLLTYRGITVISALARWLWDWSAPDIWDSSPEPAAALSTTESSPARGETLNPGCTAAIDHRRRFGRRVVGVRGYRGQLVAVVALDGPADAPHHHQTASSATLPVPAVATGLHHFDVRLDAIDIVSVRRRHAADGRPAGFEHRTWLVLRMDPQRNVGAVAARDSLASTLAAVVERLVDDLNGRRCAARPLTADEFAEVDAAVAAGLQPASTRSGLRHLKCFDGYATSFWVSPQDITSETLDRLWLDDTDVTVLTIRLSAAAGRVHAAAWVRYHSAEPLGNDVCVGLNRLVARQLAAVHASLPAPAKRPPLVVPGRPLRDDERLEIGLGQTELDAASEEHPMTEAAAV